MIERLMNAALDALATVKRSLDKPPNQRIDSFNQFILSVSFL
jgi:hypothetical protein